MDKIITQVWRVIELLVQIILIFMLAAILLGEQAGDVVNAVYANTKDFLSALPPATVAVALLVAALIWWPRKPQD